MAKMNQRGSYVLMTAAYNEEPYIERTIQSVLSQTQLPRKWVIVSDSSTDGTDSIVSRYAKRYEFIEYLRNDRPPGRSFRSKVIALAVASKLLQPLDFEFIGNLDADVSVVASYYQGLVAHFNADPALGVAGGFVCEELGANFRPRDSNRTYSVAHAAQLVRRECYEAIGGYAVLEFGGEDWHAQVSARMKGWKAESFPQLPIFHHRRTGEAGNLLRHKFRQGQMDHSFGSDPLFEALKCIRRLAEKPALLGGTARMAGYVWSCLRRSETGVSAELAKFVRAEQREKLLSFFGGLRKTYPLD